LLQRRSNLMIAVSGSLEISGKKLRKLPDIARSAWPMQEPAIWIRCWKSRILHTTTYVPWHTCYDLVPLSILSYWG
jgi:hypothetical protein